jgi:hypothetical protein
MINQAITPAMQARAALIDARVSENLVDGVEVYDVVPAGGEEDSPRIYFGIRRRAVSDRPDAQPDVASHDGRLRPAGFAIAGNVRAAVAVAGSVAEKADFEGPLPWSDPPASHICNCRQNITCPLMGVSW